MFILPLCWQYWPILEGARNSNFWYIGNLSLTGMGWMVETLFVHFPLQSLSGDYMFSLVAFCKHHQGDVRLWRDSQTWLNHCRLHVTLVAVQNRRSLHSAAKYERNTWFRCKSLVALFTQIRSRKLGAVKFRANSHLLRAVRKIQIPRTMCGNDTA